MLLKKIIIFLNSINILTKFLNTILNKFFAFCLSSLNINGYIPINNFNLEMIFTIIFSLFYNTFKSFFKYSNSIFPFS
jgi:hypothetical protein